MLEKNIDIEKLRDTFRLIFLPEIEQTIYLLEIGIRTLADYITRNLGPERLKGIVVKSTRGTVLESIQVESGGINFSNIHKISGSITLEEVFASFKALYAAFHEEISIFSGERNSLNTFSSIATFIEETYGHDFLSRFFEVMPKGLLEEKRLGFMPRRELEKRVQERTAELTKANERLQEWLHENYLSAKLLVQRDRELVATNRKMEQLNKELDETGKILVRRDMELTNSNERLRDLDAVKSQFVSVAAHQLRTPLAGIRWTLYALLEEQVGKLNDEQKKFAGDAYAATLRLIDLINDLLDVARLEEGRFGFNITRLSFTPIVQAVCKRFQKNADDKGIAFSLKLPRRKIPSLDFDEEKIMIVLENLIDNAIKYTAPGGSILISLAQDKNMVTVEVADTGIGMPKDQVSRVFTKFFRAQNAQLYQTSGTGLGLYLSKNIVEHHQGSISFTTKENGGSTFTFSLPIPKTQNSDKPSPKKKRHPVGDPTES